MASRRSWTISMPPGSRCTKQYIFFSAPLRYCRDVARLSGVGAGVAGGRTMTVYLINPSHVSFGIGVITPRWLYVLASATPVLYGTPRLIDETLESSDLSGIGPGDVVGIGIHSGNALRGYEIGTAARAAGALSLIHI